MEIRETRDYSRFKLYPVNRKVTKEHVEKLVNDPSFPEAFSVHPIVVNENYWVIDGQHRLKAAITLNIPVYFVVQYGATEKDIISCNFNQKKWTLEDYLKFYAEKGLDSYRWVVTLRDSYAITLYQAILLTRFLGDTAGAHCNNHIKQGVFALDISTRDNIDVFASKYVECIKILIVAHGKKKVTHLLGEAYIRSAIKLFREDRRKFDKFVDKLPQFFKYLPHTTYSEEATEHIENVLTKRAYNR